MKTLKDKLTAGRLALVGLLLMLASNLLPAPANPLKLGGVNRANEYLSLTALPSGANTRQLKTEPGALGSVIITGSAAGDLTLYNATTSSVLKRALATSSLQVLANFPLSSAVGTYTFDAVATDGLLAVFSGTQGTSTITYR